MDQHLVLALALGLYSLWFLLVRTALLALHTRLPKPSYDSFGGLCSLAVVGIARLCAIVMAVTLWWSVGMVFVKGLDLGAAAICVAFAAAWTPTALKDGKLYFAVRSSSIRELFAQGDKKKQ